MPSPAASASASPRAPGCAPARPPRRSGRSRPAAARDVHRLRVAHPSGSGDVGRSKPYTRKMLSARSSISARSVEILVRRRADHSLRRGLRPHPERGRDRSGCRVGTTTSVPAGETASRPCACAACRAATRAPAASSRRRSRPRDLRAVDRLLADPELSSVRRAIRPACGVDDQGAKPDDDHDREQPGDEVRDSRRQHDSSTRPATKPRDHRLASSATARRSTSVPVADVARLPRVSVGGQPPRPPSR